MICYPQLWVGHYRRGGVPRHVDFRDDGDVAIRRVSHYPPHVVLRIKPTIETRMAGGRIDVGGGGRSCRDAPRANLRESRILFDLEAPALVIAQVPMQHVQLVKRHPIDELQHELRRLKVAHRVEHQATPRETGAIRDALGRNDDMTGSGTSRRGELPQCDGGVEKSAWVAGGEQDPAWGYVDRVTLRARPGYGLIEAQDDRALGHGIDGIVGALDDA